MNLPISLRLVGRDADVEADGLAHRALRGLLDLAVAEGLQRDLPLDHLLLEHLRERREARFALGVELDLLVLQLDGAAGVLEVVAGRDLARRLVDGVADLLHVELGHDVEGGHGDLRRVGTLEAGNWRPDTVRGPGSVPEWPKGAVCKTAAQATLVRIQPGPLTSRTLDSARLAGGVCFHSMRCISTTSSHRPNFGRPRVRSPRPRSRTAAWSRMEASFPPVIRAITAWNPCRAARWTSSSSRRPADAPALVAAVQVDRVLDRRGVRRPGPEPRERPEPDDDAVELGDHRRVPPGVLVEPPDLLLEGARHHVEERGRLGDVVVVDGLDPRGVPPLGQADLHAVGPFLHLRPSIPLRRRARPVTAALHLTRAR